MQLAFQILCDQYHPLLGDLGAYRKRHFRGNAKKSKIDRENCHLPISDQTNGSPRN